ELALALLELGVHRGAREVLALVRSDAHAPAQQEREEQRPEDTAHIGAEPTADPWARHHSARAIARRREPHPAALERGRQEESTGQRRRQLAQRLAAARGAR